MAKSLPKKPSLEYLKKEAKALSKHYRKRNPSCCSILRNLNQFKEKKDREILDSDISLQNIQFAVAMEYGFKSWNEMIKIVNKKEMEMENTNIESNEDSIIETDKKPEIKVCTATVISRPKRKLIYLPAKTATEYWSYCKEVSCEWDKELNAISEKFDTAAIFEFSPSIPFAAGIEVPIDYTGIIPPGYKVIELEPCDMLYFQSEPFEREDLYKDALAEVGKAHSNYKPELYGFEYDFSLAPTFCYGASTKIGGRNAYPVKKKS